MRRGDLVTIAVAGDYGKPRPALVVQADAFLALSSVTVLRLTSELHDWPMFRVAVEPSEANGLRRPSQVMIDRAIALPREKIGAVFGRLDGATMSTVSRALAAFFGFGRYRLMRFGVGWCPGCGVAAQPGANPHAISATAVPQ